uniref:Tyrosine specific protein phosphatases domain-containing protein n=1 Tax=viral metagenome TaxID=1070528 RepID=A0A6C0AN31_9ZZZZ
MSEITDQIWLGSYKDAANERFLGERKITHILCCADELPLMVGFPYSSTLEGQKLTDIKEAAELLDIWASDGKKVMVYCSDGLGRSVSAVIEYLITYKQWSYMLAYDHLKLRRNI